jgi:hypothetical protein
MGVLATGSIFCSSRGGMSEGLTFVLQIEPRSTCGCLRTRQPEGDLQQPCSAVRKATDVRPEHSAWLPCRPGAKRREKRDGIQAAQNQFIGSIHTWPRARTVRTCFGVAEDANCARQNNESGSATLSRAEKKTSVKHLRQRRNTKLPFRH